MSLLHFFYHQCISCFSSHSFFSQHCNHIINIKFSCNISSFQDFESAPFICFSCNNWHLWIQSLYQLQDILFQLSDLSWNLKVSLIIFHLLFSDVSINIWWNDFGELLGYLTVPYVFTKIVNCPPEISAEIHKTFYKLYKHLFNYK